MTGLRDLLDRHVSDGTVPGAVAMVARPDRVDRPDRVEVAAVGSADVEGVSPMARDSIFRIASITKPIAAAAVLTLVEDGRIALDTPIAEWLPELASPMVVRTPASPVDDLVPANRPITVFDLLTFRAGYGFPDDFSLPAVEALFAVQPDGREVRLPPPPDVWMAALARVPMVSQPGESWLYNTCSDLQGVLIARVSGQSLPDYLAERLFEPLGMVDTGFMVPAASRDRFTSYYRRNVDGVLELVDGPDGYWNSLPDFPSRAGGLVSTLDDWHALARMLLAGGVVGDRRLLSEESVRQMTTNHLTQEQRDDSTLFLEGQGWGYGGQVDVTTIEPWTVPGRYGWTGGTGTSAHIVPATGAVSILLTQVAVDSPVPMAHLKEFWEYAAG